MFIDAFGIGGYKSFGPDLQRFGSLKKMNLLIGQNNSGKSNVLFFLRDHYASTFKSCRGDGKYTPKPIIPLDIHQVTQDQKSEHLIFCAGLNLNGWKYEETLKIAEVKLKKKNVPIDCVKKILESKTLTKDSNTCWFEYQALWSSDLLLTRGQVDEILKENVISESDWINLWNAFFNQQIEPLGIMEQTITAVLGFLSPVKFEPPSVDLIPAVRKIGGTGQQKKLDHLGGEGIIEKLFTMKNPGFEKLQEEETFAQITQFVQNVVGVKDLKLKVPHSKETILIEMNNKTLPIESLGTGIHEVVILAAAATTCQNQVLCIEEPELHLHPLLQKKLIQYLIHKTTNQYFIATHSAHFLDIPEATIFHVKNKEGQTRIETVTTEDNKFSICVDLGYRASDLLQANSIIWVEGPTDRIYLNHWIHSLDPNLIEGLHYSIMFYGGRLLSHLSASDPVIDDFISLRPMNRNAVIVMDSDRNKEEDEINLTKKRIVTEFDKGPGFAWVTKGREIENYIDPEIRENAVKAIYPDAVKLKSKDQYEKGLYYVKKDGKTQEKLDKIKIAYQVIGENPNLTFLDLEMMVKKLIVFIKASSDFHDF